MDINSMDTEVDIKNLKFDDKGLILAVAQDFVTKEVLMAAYMNEEALQKTLETGKVHYYSRSRQELWLKGETSGHFQFVKQILYDCDGDSLLLLIEQVGAACHTGNTSCFYRSLSDVEPDIATKVASGEEDVLKTLYATIINRRDNPKQGSYTNYLFEKGLDKILKKVGEESSEVIIACKNQNPQEIISEVADLMFHVSVTLAECGLAWKDVYGELIMRRK